MAVDSHANAIWHGPLPTGNGITTAASGAFELPLTWKARAESRESGTSPEELIAAAHAACFAMALSFGLGNAGHAPDQLTTSSTVTFQPGTGITKIHLTVAGKVPGIDEATFQKAAAEAKAGCPVSQALAGVPEMTLDATLES
ncbi:MAG: OsmC family peroxiredoxin [Candidatus Dormibacteraceae bacterium]